MFSKNPMFSLASAGFPERIPKSTCCLCLYVVKTKHLNDTRGAKCVCVCGVLPLLIHKRTQAYTRGVLPGSCLKLSTAFLTLPNRKSGDQSFAKIHTGFPIFTLKHHSTQKLMLKTTLRLGGRKKTEPLHESRRPFLPSRSKLEKGGRGLHPALALKFFLAKPLMISTRWSGLARDLILRTPWLLRVRLLTQAETQDAWGSTQMQGLTSPYTRVARCLHIHI